MIKLDFDFYLSWNGLGLIESLLISLHLGNYISSYVFGDTRLEIVEGNFLAEQIQLLQELLLSVLGTASVNQIQNYSSLLHREHLPILDMGT